VLVPLMCCDCLSHEKREGTLGLLFLTDLKAREIVLAKAAAHGIRAITLWLAVIPIIVVPFLVGGLEWREIMASCCLAFGSICFALGAGLFASALSRRINGAVGVVVLLIPVAHVVFIVYALAALSLGAAAVTKLDWTPETFSKALETSFVLVWNGDFVWREIFSSASKYASPALVGSLCIPVASLLFLFATITVLVTPIIRRNWQDKPKTKRQSEVENFFCKPVFWTGVFRRWMRHSLECNPIGWLETRSWTGRITAWIWLAIMISFSTMLAYWAAIDRGAFYIFDALMWMLLVSIAYVAAGSFRRERETGAMELILVTPLSENQIISGRLRGLWNHFLPTFVLWAAVVIYLSTAMKEFDVATFLKFTVSYLVVPLIGLYFSLRSRFVLLSWLATITGCFAIPYVLAWLWLRVLAAMDFFPEGAVNSKYFDLLSVVVMIIQVNLALFFLWRLKINLSRRTFSFR
jgi:ABC-type transport system involved in cytochrome c biogenesis permease component